MKRVICVSQKAHVSHRDNQLHIRGEKEEITAPLEDLGLIILENHQVTITQSAISSLVGNGVAIVSCDSSHQPDGLLLPIAGNVLHTAVLRTQLNASLPLRKQLWQQTVKAKISNQAMVLRAIGVNADPMDRWCSSVRSGDPSNIEGRAAKYYWERIFTTASDFSRDPEGPPPNNLLNYGYAILRSAVARAVVSSGLHPSIGIHHQSQYNPFCLADDLMEPYRPFIDSVVRGIVAAGSSNTEITATLKKQLLSVLTADVLMGEEKKPLLTAVSTTTQSLVSCYGKASKVLKYPRYPVQRVSDHVDAGVF